jgi:hypothetical protein
MGLHLRSRRLIIWLGCRSFWRPRLESPANCRLIGRWRIVESDLWDRAHLDLSGPATLTIPRKAAKSLPRLGGSPICRTRALGGPLPVAEISPEAADPLVRRRL